MSKCCVICVGRNADRAADRIEAYAKKADFEIVETIFKDTKSVERLKFYIERDSIISILVSSIYDVSSDKDVVKGIMELAAEHGISINDESRGYEPALMPVEKKVAGMIAKTGNPYFRRSGKSKIKISFSDNGESLKDNYIAMLANV